MPLKVVRNDIARMEVDAIVNPTNRNLTPTGGADAAIHKAAGEELRAACRKIGHLAPGEAAITDGYQLPCSYVIHTVGPSWLSGKKHSREVLAACYHRCMDLAIQNKCRSLAFPLIASGSLGVPKDQALYIAVDCIRNHPKFPLLDITLVVFDQRAFSLSAEMFSNVQSYIDETYVGQAWRNETCTLPSLDKESATFDGSDFEYAAPHPVYSQRRPKLSAPSFRLDDLKAQMKTLDESFSEMLLRKISESGMTDAECYKKAHIDRKLFSKIRSDSHYRPSKATVLSFAIALEMPLEDTCELLQKAGFAFSHSSKFDIIVEFFIKNGHYDIFEINEALFSFDQSLLGV